jgi:hypothetical protein
VNLVNIVRKISLVLHANSLQYIGKPKQHIATFHFICVCGQSLSGLSCEEGCNGLEPEHVRERRGIKKYLLGKI